MKQPKFYLLALLFCVAMAGCGDKTPEDVVPADKQYNVGNEWVTIEGEVTGGKVSASEYAIGLKQVIKNKKK
jgi:predicted small lipoprotein YifL